MKIAVYTAVTNGYDRVNPVQDRVHGVDYLLLTDDHDLRVEGWETVAIHRSQRATKIYPWIDHIFEKYDLLIYHDANLTMKQGSLGKIVQKMLSGALFLTTKHPQRNCIFEEIQRCVDLKKDDLDLLYTIRNQCVWDREIWPKQGMIASAFMARWNIPAVREFCATWFKYHYNLQGKRDQISYGYAIQKGADKTLVTTLEWHQTFGQLFDKHQHLK